MSFRERLVFWLGRGNLDLPLRRLEPVRDEVEVDGEGEAEVEAGSGPRRYFADCLGGGLGWATLGVRRDCAKKLTGPSRSLTEGTVGPSDEGGDEEVVDVVVEEAGWVLGGGALVELCFELG